MRKLSEKQKKHFRRQAVDRDLRRLVWKEWTKRRRPKSGVRTAVVHRSGKRFRTRALSAVPLPRVFCLDENTSETLAALHNLRRDVLSRAMELRNDSENGVKKEVKLRKYFDIKTIRQIGPSAALILAAIFQRSKYITGRRLHTIDEHKWHEDVMWVLRALGFHELLEMRPLRRGRAYTGSVKIQPFVSGQRADGEELGKLQDALALLLPDELRHKLFTAEPYGGMLEAILNSYSWAYPSNASWEFTALKNWWLTGAVDTETNQVIVCAYDQGISIPASLPHWEHWSTVEFRAKRFMERLKLSRPLDHYSNDALAIRIAMTIAKTATKLPQHGKGLHTMVEVAERAKYGRLRILSRNGEYIWETGKRPKTITHEFPLEGTLVEWQLEL